MLNTVQRQFFFITKFFQSPRRIGAIAPSGSALAQEMVRQAGVKNSQAILEFGPGTGAFTREIIAAKPKHARLLSIEADARLAVLLRKEFQKTSIAAGFAQNAGRIMKAYNFPTPDCIISGLPWAMFDSKTQSDILMEAKKVLKPGGIFTTFAYIHALSLPEAKSFRSLLENNFASVTTSRIIWTNLPPRHSLLLQKTLNLNCSHLQKDFFYKINC